MMQWHITRTVGLLFSKCGIVSWELLCGPDGIVVVPKGAGLPWRMGIAAGLRQGAALLQLIKDNTGKDCDYLLDDEETNNWRKIGYKDIRKINIERRGILGLQGRIEIIACRQRPVEYSIHQSTVDRTRVIMRELFPNVYTESGFNKPAGSQQGRSKIVALGVFGSILGILFGVIFGGMAWQGNNRRSAMSQGPHTITFEQLLADGPGTNQFVALSDFRLGTDYVTERNNYGTWTLVTIPIFPSTRSVDGDVKAVVSTNNLHNDEEVRQFCQRKTLVGISSSSPTWIGTRWNELKKKYPGMASENVWVLEDLQEIPSLRTIQLEAVGSAVLLISSIVCVIAARRNR